MNFSLDKMKRNALLEPLGFSHNASQSTCMKLEESHLLILALDYLKERVWKVRQMTPHGRPSGQMPGTLCPHTPSPSLMSPYTVRTGSPDHCRADVDVDLGRAGIGQSQSTPHTGDSCSGTEVSAGEPQSTATLPGFPL